MSVVWLLAWPSQSETLRRSRVAWSVLSAHECRSTCGETCFSRSDGHRPAATATAVTGSLWRIARGAFPYHPCAMIIRVLMLAGLATIGWLVFLRRNKLPIHIVIVFGLLGAGAWAVLFPDQTDAIANWVGVGTGRDLITYLFEITAMFVLIHYYTKFVELQRQLTDLVREMALLRADLDRDRPP